MNKEFNEIEELEGLRIVHMGAGARMVCCRRNDLTLELTQQQVAEMAR